MQSPVNSFALNLKQQKSIAKKRLKAIRNGDHSVMANVLQFHSRPAAINANNIQLADVQHALARELGLPNWSQLKQHIERLDQHRQAISDHAPALDRNITTLHVRCGNDIQDTLRSCGFEGEFLALIDPLCIGPLPASQHNFIAHRAQYVLQTLLPIMGSGDEDIANIIATETANLATLLDDSYKRIVFWVEHDSYDQLMLIHALTQLKPTQSSIIEIIEINQFPGTEQFIGFGQLPAEAIRACWQRRRAVTPQMINQAICCWGSLTSSQPSAIAELIKTDALDSLPNMTNVLIRHLQELPNQRTGLSLTQTLALQVLSDRKTPITVSDWFTEYQSKEPLPFLGDVMFYALLLPLMQGHAPLATLTNQQSPWWEHTISITEHGMACLHGSNPCIQDYWVGGIHCTESAKWQWDHLDITTLTQV